MLQVVLGQGLMREKKFAEIFGGEPSRNYLENFKDF